MKQSFFTSNPWRFSPAGLSSHFVPMVATLLRTVLVIAALGTACAVPSGKAFALSAIVQKDDDKKDDQKKGQSPALASIEMKSIYFNMIRNGAVQGAVAIDLVLLINDATDVEEINNRLPQIRSDFLHALLALSKRRFRINTPPNVDHIKSFLSPIADRRLGAGRVQIFVKNATITPNKD